MRYKVTLKDILIANFTPSGEDRDGWGWLVKRVKGSYEHDSKQIAEGQEKLSGDKCIWFSAIVAFCFIIKVVVYIISWMCDPRNMFNFGAGSGSYDYMDVASSINSHSEETCEVEFEEAPETYRHMDELNRVSMEEAVKRVEEAVSKKTSKLVGQILTKTPTGYIVTFGREVNIALSVIYPRLEAIKSCYDFDFLFFTPNLVDELERTIGEKLGNQIRVSLTDKKKNDNI